MATLSYTIKRLFKANVKSGARMSKFVTIVGDTDIGAADTGYSRTAAQLGFNVIEGCIGGATRDGVYFVVGTPAAAGASINFQYYNADDAVEAAAGENGVDGSIVDLVVFGY